MSPGSGTTRPYTTTRARQRARGANTPWQMSRLVSGRGALEPIRSGRGSAGLGWGGAGTLPRVAEGKVREDLPDDRWIVQRGDQP
jgi:hypothetical protein